MGTHGESDGEVGGETVDACATGGLDRARLHPYTRMSVATGKSNKRTKGGHNLSSLPAPPARFERRLHTDVRVEQYALSVCVAL